MSLTSSPCDAVPFGATIPNSVTSIGRSAFYGCSGLTSVEIPNSVTSIGDDAFCYCSGLTNVIIPNSVTSIGHEAFFYCSGLTSIEIPSSVISIGASVFYGCFNLANIAVPDNVTSVGHSAFESTPWYNNLPAGVIYIGNVLYGYKGTMLENTSIVVKDGTIMICGSAFSGCSGLTSIEIPNTVIIIGGSAFYGTYWYNNQPDGVVYAGNVLYDYKGDMPENTIIVIKDGTISITDGAFSEMEELVGVEIPNSVKYIGYENFDNTAISSIELPEGVENIGDRVFTSCEMLADVVIPSSVKSIGEYAFAYCPALTSIKSYIAKEDLFVPGNDVFYDVDKSKCTLYVPYGTKDVYASTAGWSDFLNICEFDATVIDDVKGEDGNVEGIYDLSGRRVTEISKSGLYIVNGKKVLVK